MRDEQVFGTVAEKQPPCQESPSLYPDMIVLSICTKPNIGKAAAAGLHCHKISCRASRLYFTNLIFNPFNRCLSKTYCRSSGGRRDNFDIAEALNPMSIMTSPQRAPRVCRICRIKKKACGKELPTCSYCFKRGFDCVYETESDTHPMSENVAEAFKPWSLTLFPMSISTATLDRTMAYHMHYLYKVVGQSPLQSGQRFLDNFQRWLPIIAPRRLHEHIELSEQGLPGADVSILLLSICLVTLRSGGDLDDPFLHSSAVHVTVKTLYAQVQAITHASIALVQAGVVLSAYEYASGQIDSAYISIAACIRMAQVVDVDTAYEKLGATQEETRLQATSEWNLWWSIIVLERYRISLEFRRWLIGD